MVNVKVGHGGVSHLFVAPCTKSGYVARCRPPSRRKTVHSKTKEFFTVFHTPDVKFLASEVFSDPRDGPREVLFCHSAGCNLKQRFSWAPFSVSCAVLAPWRLLMVGRIGRKGRRAARPSHLRCTCTAPPPLRSAFAGHGHEVLGASRAAREARAKRQQTHPLAR